MSNRILVTGGCGYIGSHTVVELCSFGYTPIIVDNFSTSRPNVLEAIKQIVGASCEIFFVEADVRDTKAVSETIKRFNIDAVVHFAGFKSVYESVNDPVRYMSNNVNGLISLIEGMNSLSTKKIIFSSSCTVYGTPRGTSVKESDPLNPINPYGTSKKLCETVLRECSTPSTAFNVISLRYFNPIGAHPSGLIGDAPINESTNVLPSLFRAARQKLKFKVFGSDYETGDGSAVRDYIHVVDLAKSHALAIQRLIDQQNHFGFLPLNVGLGKGVSVLELIKHVEQLLGTRIPFEFHPRRAGDAPAIFANTCRIQKEIPSWTPTHSLVDAIESHLRFSEINRV